ncbi:hypothetical protein VE04_08536 [Pseudogymnoascus sp. 24MN13]|nr:hypothetical protein VE04_08536 [Pseudogymnoascus sp. 24MN13]
MLDGLFILLVLSVVMAVASFLAGALPLSMSLSQSQLRLLSAIGMGVLVGTSLVVIIPEGIEAVYASSIPVHTNGARAPRLLTPRTFDNPTFYEAASALPGPVIPVDTSIFDRRADTDAVADADFPTIHNDDAPLSTSSSGSSTCTAHNHAAERSPPTFYIGFSLITGFVLILATTTGLVIHAAADGIAMGAAATSSNTKLGFIIFLAIMLHKAPAAFGLTSVLLKQGLSKRAARGHLIIFSLAAPIGAFDDLAAGKHRGGGRGHGGREWTVVDWDAVVVFGGHVFVCCYARDAG